MSYGDIRDVLEQLPHPPGNGTSYALSDIFPRKHEVIRSLRPKPTSVFEFGALYGYFLVTALDAAPSIERVGWVDTEEHTSGSNVLCMRNLKGYGRTLTDRAATLVYQYFDRDDLPRITSPYDLVHVDGDHSHAGCLLDLQAADELGARWIIVDDWSADTHRIEIRRAANNFVYKSSSTWKLTEHETVNGFALLERQS